MGIIFAGVINTGVNCKFYSYCYIPFLISSPRKACWTLLFLGSSPVWKKKVVDELKALIANHTNTLSSEPLHKRLASIPLNAWEDELPTIDIVIRETLRITTTGSTLRRNMHKEVTIEGVTVKRGDFLTYQLGDAHLNPEIYKNPLEFDPSRFLAGREEDRKETFAFLGWGVGAYQMMIRHHSYNGELLI